MIMYNFEWFVFTIKHKFALLLQGLFYSASIKKH